MPGGPLFSLQKSSPLLILFIFRKIQKKSDREKLYIFQFFDSKRSKFTPFATGYDRQFSIQDVIFTKWNDTSYKYLLNRLVSVNTNIKCLLQQFIFIAFNTWRSPSQIKSTVKTSINTVVFRTGYLEKERCDPPIFLPLWPELVIT